MSVAATKKKAPIRIERLETRVTPETKALCQKAAELQGRTLSDFVVSSALDAARKALRENEAAELTYRDRLAFAQALAQPMEPNAKLREAMARHSSTSSES